uniref:Uncharacterized protein n=1 Tax=Tetranychus urticae TaxID=32264 RepID=T1K4B0_TETUR
MNSENNGQQQQQENNSDNASVGGNGSDKNPNPIRQQQTSATLIEPVINEYVENLQKNCDTFAEFIEIWNMHKHSESFLPSIEAELSKISRPILLSYEEIEENKIHFTTAIRDDVHRNFYYSIMQANQRLTINELKKKLDEFIGKNGPNRYCKGTPACLIDGKKECKASGPSDYVLSHVQNAMEIPNVCYYCRKKNFRIAQFKDHFIKVHWALGFGERKITEAYSSDID